jgi:hypothetical protein
MHYILEYLAALHSPIPTIDSSLTSFVLFQAIFLVIMFTGIVMLVALPHFIKTISSSVGSIYPGLYSTGPRSKGWTFWRSHILYFAPMYAFLLGLQALGFAIVMFGLGSLVEFIILKYAPPKSLGLKDQPKALGYCVFASAAASLCSLLTLPFIVPVVLSFMGSSSWGGIVIIGIFLLIHTASATVFSHKNTFLPNAIALIIAVTIVLSLMKPAQVAGGTLRYFRVGGRIPIVLSPASAAFDSDPSNSPSRTTHSVNVCLVLTIGNELFATTPKKGGCPPKASYLWEHPEEFGPIGIYNRSDCFIANVSPVGASVPDKGKKQ